MQQYQVTDQDGHQWVENGYLFLCEWVCLDASVFERFWTAVDYVSVSQKLQEVMTNPPEFIEFTDPRIQQEAM